MKGRQRDELVEAVLEMFPSPCGELELKGHFLDVTLKAEVLFPSPCGELELKGPNWKPSSIHPHQTFPSPCGELELKAPGLGHPNAKVSRFPSPCGELELKDAENNMNKKNGQRFRPLAGSWS